MKRWLFGTTFFIIAFAALHFYVLKQSAVLPATEVVKLSSIEHHVVISGQIVPERIIQIKSMISGTVSQIYTKEGEPVKAGQTLVDILPTATPNALAEATANVQQTLAALYKAKRDYIRYHKLFEQRTVAASDLDTARETLDTAKSQYQLAVEKASILKTGATTIKDTLIKSTVTSPIDGMVLQRNIDLGDVVVPLTESQPGTPLFFIANLNHLVFRGMVSQQDMNFLRPGLDAAIELAAIQGRLFKGKLERISPKSIQGDSDANVSQSVFHLDATFKNGFIIEVGDFQLPINLANHVGYQATATFITDRVNQVPALSERAIIFDDNEKPYVWLNAKKPEKRYVTLGLSDGTFVEIKSGLSVGQMVLLDQVSD